MDPYKVPDWKLQVETELVRKNLGEATRGSHEPRPLMPPIYTAATYVLESCEEGRELSESHAESGYLYQRWGNPTNDSTADVIARMEGAKGTLLFASGCGAISTTLLSFLKAGDHVVMCWPVYGGVKSVVDSIITKLGVEVTYVKNFSEYKDAVKSNTKVLYGETPCNPTMSILDLEAFGALGKSLPGVVTMVDVTFASPYLVQPISYGVDIAIHSCTKYLGGHSDLVGGAVSYSTVELGTQIKHHLILLGGPMSPFTAYLLYRSLKTLAVRMDRHCENAQKVAEFLEAHPKVKTVYYPGLPSHPQHELAKKQMKRGFSGMLSFELHGTLENGVTLVENLKVITSAVSLGGVESLVCHPASTTHCDKCVSPEDRKKGGITDTLLRLSIGIESAEDLIKDLEQALEKI